MSQEEKNWVIMRQGKKWEDKKIRIWQNWLDEQKEMKKDEIKRLDEEEKCIMKRQGDKAWEENRNDERSDEMTRQDERRDERMERE